MALEGIRLTDIHGYDNNDYLNYINNNVESINQIRQMYGFSDDDKSVEQELYLNNLIKNKIGDEGYNSNVRGKNMSLENKLSYYNSLFDEPLESERTGSTDLITDEYDSQFEESNPDNYTLWLNGDMWPGDKNSPVQQMTIKEYFHNKVKKSDESDTDNKPKTLFGFAIPNEEEDFELQAFDRLYDPNYTARPQNEFEGTQMEKDIADYSNNIRAELDRDPNFTYNLFEQFENLMLKTSQYYQNYHDTTMMRFTPNEMKDILSTYYAIKNLKNDDEAIKFASESFQNKVASEQGLWNKFTNGWYAGAANLTGSTIGGVGIVLNTIPAIIKATSEDNDIDGANWFQEVMYYAADNDITRYGINCIETGVWNPELQRQYKESGYNPYANIRYSGHESDFLDINTLFDLGPQMMFTVAGMAQGSFASAALKGTVKAAINPLTRKLMTTGATRFMNSLGSGIDALADGIVVAGTAALPAASEAAVDAFQTYDDIMNQSFKGVNDAVDIIVKDALENGEFQNFYNARTSFELPSDEIKRNLSDEELDYIDRKHQENIQNIYNEFVEYKRNQILNDSEYSDMIHNEALRQAAKNMMDETMFIAFGDIFFTKVLGGTFKNAKKAIKARLGIQSPYSLYRDANGALRAAKESLSNGDKLKAIAKGIIEPAEEGFEELYQNVDTELRKDLASNYVTQWILNRHNLGSGKQVSDSISENMAVVEQSLKKNILSKESIYSFLMGAVSAGIGSPTVFNGVRHGITSYTNGQATTFKDVAVDILKNSWRNPMVEAYKEAKLENTKRQNEIDAVNRWLENHDEVAKMQDFISIYSWAKQQETAAATDNEKDFRDANMGQEIATLFMMDRIGGSAKERSFSKKLKEMANLNESSEAAQSLINQAAAIQGIQNAPEEQRHEIFNDIKSKAKELFEMQKDIHEARKWIHGNFGEVLDSEAIDAWAYETIMHRNIMSRVNEIDQFVKDSYNTSQNAKKNPRAASPADNFIARYGSINGAKSRQEQLQKEISDAQKNKNGLKRKLGTFGYSSYISLLKEKLNKVKSDIAEFDKYDITEDQVVMAENIAFLDVESRAALLKDENLGKYSTKQQNEIRKFKETQKVDQDLLDSIQDAADLLDRYNSFNRRFKEIQKNAQNAVLYNNEVKAEVVRRVATEKLSPVINAEDYNTFKTELDKFRNDPQNDFADAVINDILHDNKFYDDYVKELNKRNDALSIMRLSDTFKSLDDEHKRLLTQAYNQALQDGDTSFGNVIKYINNDYLRDDLALSMGLNTSEFSEQISEILQQIENHNRNTENLKKLESDLSTPGHGAPQENPVPQPRSRSLVLNTSYYDAHKENINRIISNIHKYLVGKKSSIKISADDFISFMNLFTGEVISNNTLIDLDSTDLSMSSMIDIYNRLNNSIESYKMTHSEGEYSDEFLNTFKLFNAIKNYITKYNVSQVRSGIKMRENDFLRAVLSQLTPELRSELGDTKKQNSTNIGVVNIKVKLDDKLSYDAEKEYYENNNISENRKTLKNIVNSKTQPTLVLIHDAELSDKIRKESGVEQFDSDNLPLIAAVIVPNGTKNSIIVDGQNVLPIGLIHDSRKNPSKDVANNLNNLRQLVIDSGINGVVKNVDGSIYLMKGLNIKFAHNTDTSMSSVRDYLIDKYKTKEAAVQAFKDGIAKVTLIKKDESTIEASYQDPYTKEMKYPRYNIPEGSWKDRERHTMLLYIDRDNPNNPIFLYDRQINEISLFDDSEDTIYDILNSGVDITSKEFANKDINSVRGAVNKIINDLLTENGIGRIIQYGENEAKKISDKLTESISNDYLNFGKLSFSEKSPNKLSLRYDKASHVLSMYLTIYDKDTQKTTDILLAQTDELNKDNLKNPTKEAIIKQFALESIKNLMFNEDGTPRMNTQNTYPLVKLQIKQEDAINKKKDYARKLLLTNVFYGRVRDLQQEIEDIDINSTSQKKSSEDKRTAAIERLMPFLKGNRPFPPDAIQVTEFIRQDKDETIKDENTPTSKQEQDYNNIDKENVSVNERVKLSMGTSIDKLIRVYFQVGRSKEAVLEWMNKNKMHYWLGFGSQGNEQFNELFREVKGHPEKDGLIVKLDKFFAERDETVLTQEFQFDSEIEDEFGRKAKVVGIPDIITVDKNGNYHIYDMKSFKFSYGATSYLNGFNNDKFGVKGLHGKDAHLLSWQKQLTLYKELLERCVGKGKVVSLGIIPIAFDYKLGNDVIVTSNPLTAIDERGEVYDIRTKISGSDKTTPFHINRTITPKDLIYILPITQLSSIGSTKWRESINGQEQGSAIGIIESMKKAKENVGHINDIVTSGSIAQEEIDLDDASEEEIDDLFISLMPTSDIGGIDDRLNNNTCLTK